MGKLVRSEIPALKRKAGEHAVARILPQRGREHQIALAEKLVEEAAELLEAVKANNSEDILGEFADVTQVHIDLRWVLRLTNPSVEGMVKRKLRTNGGFKKGVYLEDEEK